MDYPIFVSPQNDNGYDVADYYNIDPIYGTMDDLENLIKEAKKEIWVSCLISYLIIRLQSMSGSKALKGDSIIKIFIYLKILKKVRVPQQIGNQNLEAMLGSL